MGSKPRPWRLAWVNLRSDGCYATETRWSRYIGDAQIFATRSLAEMDVFYMRDEVQQVRVRVTIECLKDR